MTIFFPIVFIFIHLLSIFANRTVMNVSGFDWKYRYKKQTGISGILFQYPFCGVVAMVTVLLVMTLLLFYYFIVGSEDEDHVSVFNKVFLGFR